MSNQEILYVAYRDEPVDEGVSYAAYLSSLLGEKLRVVLLGRNGAGKRLNDLMSAVTFAEAGEHETARDFLSGENGSADSARIQNYVIEKCRREGIEATVHIGLDATAAVILNFLRQKKIDMVLLSPAITESRSILNKLVKISPRPVVTMARGNGFSN